MVPEDGKVWADRDCEFSINGATIDGLDRHGPRMINAINVNEAYSFHSGGTNFAMADGSTHFFSESTEAETFVGLSTFADGEVVREF